MNRNDILVKSESEITFEEALMFTAAMKGWDGKTSSIFKTIIANGFGDLSVEFVVRAFAQSKGWKP